MYGTRLDSAGYEGGLHLSYRVVDFVGTGQGDVEGQDLVGERGQGCFLEARDGVQAQAAEGVDGRIDGDRTAGQGGVEDRVLRQEDVLVGAELEMSSTLAM